LSSKFIRDAREIVKAGDIVKVKVIEIDLTRQRVGLTMRMDAPVGVAQAGEPARAPDRRSAGGQGNAGAGRGRPAAPGGAMAEAFARLSGSKS
jgi:uncharacterized protein